MDRRMKEQEYTANLLERSLSGNDFEVRRLRKEVNRLTEEVQTLTKERNKLMELNKDLLDVLSRLLYE